LWLLYRNGFGGNRVNLRRCSCVNRSIKIVSGSRRDSSIGIGFGADSSFDARGGFDNFVLFRSFGLIERRQ
jgi:hypothetical protein